MKSILALIITITGLSAFADQCQWNTASDAESARALINLHKDVMFYCQNCGDAKPSFISEVKSVATAQAKMGNQKYPYRTVMLTLENGSQQEVDLAYLYVRTASDIFANTAQLVGCPSEGAVSFIQTTNRNQKLQHYYNDQGVRIEVAATSAQTEKGTGAGRVPASTPSKTK